MNRKSLHGGTGDSLMSRLLCSGRMQFMLDVITSLRTNNPQKIPGYDPDRIENMRRLLKTHIKGKELHHYVVATFCDLK